MASEMNSSLWFKSALHESYFIITAWFSWNVLKLECLPVSFLRWTFWLTVSSLIHCTQLSPYGFFANDYLITPVRLQKSQWLRLKILVFIWILSHLRKPKCFLLVIFNIPRGICVCWKKIRVGMMVTELLEIILSHQQLGWEFRDLSGQVA